METKMSERDKKLLFLLVIVVIVAVFGYFLIYPTITRMGEKDTKIAELSASWQAREDKLVTLASKTQLLDAVKENYDNSVSYFYHNMSSRDIEKTLTSFELSNGITVREMDITMNDNFTNVTKFSDIVAVAEQKKNSADASSPAIPEELPGVYAADVYMVLSAPRETLAKSIDGLYENFQSIRVVNFTWNESLRENVPDEERYTLSVNLQLFMADSSDERIIKEEASENARNAEEAAKEQE